MANLWFTKASLVDLVDTRPGFSRERRKKREELRDDILLAQGVFACICTNSVVFTGC
jgi:hypothetical protein